jgi:serine/threonine protein kinase
MTSGMTEHVRSDAFLQQQPIGSINAGDVIDGKYQVGECIAWGGMGIVTEAIHLDLRKVVALKCVRPEFLDNEEMVARFLNEARIAANLRNEHVARVLDFGKTKEGIAYLVMERLEGMSLKALVIQRGPVPVAEAVDYVLQACEALAEAHAQGIVHRDIKPENLFLSRSVNGTPILKVLDFGISKQLSSQMGMLTNPGSSMGSPCYMSPEQMRNPGLVDKRTDVWATGAVLFELLSAQPPFAGDSLPEICAHVMCDVPRSLKDLRAELPSGLEAVVRRCLEKDRDERFSDVAELARALAPYASLDGRVSLPNIEHMTSNSEPPYSAEHAVDSSASFAPTLLQPSPAVTEEGYRSDDATDDEVSRIPGVRRRWPLLLCFAAGLAVAGVGTVRYLGYDVVRPLRGSILAGNLGAEVHDALPVRATVEFRLPPARALARAERERDAPGASPETPSSPAPPSSSNSNEDNANTAAEPPDEPPARPSPDDPYALPSAL